MQLYIANATMQNRVANIRLPEVTKNVQMEIPRGRQVRVPKDLNTPDIDSIKAQLANYGAIDVEEVNSRRTYAVTIPYILSVGKPVPIAAIKRVMDHNRGTLVLRGQETRQQAALASAQVMAEAVPGTLESFETVLVEDKPGESQHEPVAEALRVEGENVQGGKTVDKTTKKRR